MEGIALVEPELGAGAGAPVVAWLEVRGAGAKPEGGKLVGGNGRCVSAEGKEEGRDDAC